MHLYTLRFTSLATHFACYNCLFQLCRINLIHSIKQLYTNCLSCLYGDLHPSPNTLLVIIVYFDLVVLTKFIELSSFLPITAVVYIKI